MRWSRPLLTLLLACAHPVAPPPTAEASLNLGFEEGDLPAGWEIGPAGGGYPVTVDQATARTGTRSARLASSPGGAFGSIQRRLDAAPFVGKRLRVHAWVKTEAVTGWASVWLRVDGGEATYVFADAPLTPSEEWSEVVADAFIAPGQVVTFGGVLQGEGTAWFDDFSLEVIEPPPVVPVGLGGSVVGPSGAPIPGADVALLSPAGEIAQHVHSDGAGRFSFATTAGTWGVSAVATGRPDLVGSFVPQTPYPTGRSDLELRLGGEGGVAVSGRVEGAVGPGGYLSVAPYSAFDADIFAVPISADGSFGARLPRGDRYGLSVLHGGVGSGQAVREGDSATATLTVVPAVPAPAAVVEWITRAAAPLTTVVPGGDLSDLAGLGRIVGDARVVALGEATHGTREFFQLKDRVFEYLVREQAFTVFALEIGQVEARTIDAYVQGGAGTARVALGAGRMWIWETEEMLEQIEWMRAWNAAPTHVRKVHFVGFDLQDPSQSYAAVRSYLERVAPAEAPGLLAPLEVLGRESGRTAFVTLSAAERTAVLDAVSALTDRFDASRAAWEAASSPEAFAVARHDARILQQGAEQFALQDQPGVGSAARDRAMAENIRWLLDDLPADARMVVSAHNAHIGDVSTPTVSMGHALREALGPELVTVGLELGDGAFQAIQTRQDGARGNVEAIPLDPPEEGLANAALLRAGLPLYALDLRTVPADGAVADWFRAPQLVREAGYRVGSRPGWVAPQRLVELYDALLFVAHTTRARPLPADLTRTP